jgi:dTDP-4-amino-4,6-dideoxygalactose transaminase
MSYKNIPFFEYPRLYKDNKENLLKIIDDIGSRGAFIMQKDLQDFEASLAKFTKAKYSIGVANATDGLELAWMSINLRAGDEVICCSHTMLATASAIKTAGGTPVVVDIGNDGLIDPDAVEAAINPRTVGIMPTQLNGRTCNMDRIMSIADKYRLYVVEDAAQALGSSFKGRHAGTFGHASAISFFPAKVLGSLGDGGAVLTNNEHIFDRVYQLHDHGRDVNGEVRSWGRNSRLDNLQAAILNHNLKTYSDVIARRRSIAELYQNYLSDIEELILPPSPDANPEHFDVYQNYEMQANKRNDLKDYLKAHGVGTLVQWGGKAVHQWEHLGFTIKLPKVERYFESCIMLPMNMFITDDDVLYICKTIRSFYRS